MRRAVAISLLLLFSWTLIAPFAVVGAEAGQRACCCGHGVCHCRMRLRHGTVSGSQKGFTTVAQKCPCCPASASVVYSSSFKPESAPAFSAEAVFHPALTAQAAALFRILFLRNNPKRGPPTLLI